MSEKTRGRGAGRATKAVNFGVPKFADGCRHQVFAPPNHPGDIFTGRSLPPASPSPRGLPRGGGHAVNGRSHAFAAIFIAGGVVSQVQENNQAPARKTRLNMAQTVDFTGLFWCRPSLFVARALCKLGYRLIPSSLYSLIAGCTAQTSLDYRPHILLSRPLV